MKKTLLFAVAASMLFATSCKETLLPIVTEGDANATDTTYTENVEDAQSKRIYIEELTGVTCVNCPDGAAQLHTLSTVDFPDELSIIAFHAGASFTDPMPENKYDFRTSDGDQIWQNVWKIGDAKPCAVIDRVSGLTPPSSSTENPIYNKGKGTWKPAILKDKELYPNTPVNVYITSGFNSEKNRYDITVKVKYTSTVNYGNALHIFLAQDSIVDAQLFPGQGHNVDTAYVFNHVFRKAITNAVTGNVILPDMPTKSPGRVYEYKTWIAIDPNDNIQKNWVPEQMHVTAFVSAVPTSENSNDIHVLQVQETKLKN